MSNEIVRISNIAKQFQKVDSVMYALNKENLKINAIRIAGNRAVGIDQVTKREYIANLDENLDNLILIMKKMAYKPKAVRRVYIPKPGSDKKRPLGIPAFIRYIKRFLKSGILEQGKLLKPELGTPQRRNNITSVRKYISTLCIR